ncbi:MAG: MFS transporter [Sphingobium sp.]|nr:MFS transporter [Sphingobium sp.]
MFPSPEYERAHTRPRLWALTLFLGAALIGCLSYVTWLWHIAGKSYRSLAPYFFARQDIWVLDGYVAVLALMAIWAWNLKSPGAVRRPGGGQALFILLGIVAVVLAARLGRDLVFHGYSPSRDELMVELAGDYLSQGRIGWSIPPDWLDYRRALQPEFYSPYGADTHWTAIYLPVHAAIRALFVRLGDAALAAPVTLGVGLLALWQVARRLLPNRPDAQAVVMVMAFSSTQLIATAMTPYAMTSHFAFDMVWLMLVLRGGKLGHGLAAIVALLAAGLHQWHFPLLFMGPFILWLLARRNWRAALFHGFVCIAMMVVWARLWPMLLVHEVGPAPITDAHRTNGIWDKIESLFGRLDTWQPGLNNARLISWNNIMLLPLAFLAVFAPNWRRAFKEPSIVLPLLMVAGSGMGFALYQGYGWGFRYMHGGIGALALLAGFGWTAVVRPGDKKAGQLLAFATIASLLAAAWLLFDTERYVRGYARSMAAIRAAQADVVLVDIRGGYYMTDLVRFDEGRLGHPAVMALHMLSDDQIDRLCATHRVAIADRTLFWPLGVHQVSPVFPGSDDVQARRDHLAQIGCGKTIRP